MKTYMTWIKLVLITGICLGFLSPSAAQEINSSGKVLVLIDTSKSMGLPAIESFKILLANSARNDQYARSTTIIHYPTSLGPRIVSFSNSSELESLLSQFIPSFGRTNLMNVFDLADSWTLANSYDKSKVIWITDGGGVATASQVFSIAGQMEEVAPLENWQIFDYSENSLMATYKGIVGSYRYFGANPSLNLEQINFDQLIQLQPIKPERGEINFSNPILILLSLLSGIVVLYVLVFLFGIVDKYLAKRNRKSALGGSPALSRKLVKNESNLFWEMLPKIWKKPGESYLSAGYDEQSDTKKLIVTLAMFVALAITFLIMTGNFAAAIILAVAFTPVFFKILYRIRKRKYDVIFEKALPGILMLTSSGLRSGLSLEHGLDAYTYDNASIASKEIKRVLSEIRLGASTEVALQDLADRRNCEDLAWVVTALSIQRNVGGSLSSIIDTVLETITERAELRREIRTLSAEGRLSAYVLVALPVGLFMFLYVSRREYVQVYWSDPLGILVLIVILILISVGWFWMQKVVNIKA